jgi:hypothetical protein
MRISGCRLEEKRQDRLAEFFVGGVTARSAADLVGVNRKTTAYFYHRLRQLIAEQLEDAIPVEGLFWRRPERQARPARFLSSVSSSAAARSTL